MEGQAGPKPGERSWPPRLRLSLFLFLFIFLTFLLRFSRVFLPLFRGADIAFLFCLCCAALRCSLSLSLPFSPLLLSLSLFLPRRAKMVHGRSRTPISPRILRGESTSTPLYPAPPLPVLPLYSPRFFAPAASQSRRGFSSRYSFLYARDCIVHLFNAP